MFRISVYVWAFFLLAPCVLPTAAQQTVHELGGGTSAVRFDYRIVALRKDFENIRVADHTNDPDPLKMMKQHPATRLDIHKLMPPVRTVSMVRPITKTATKKRK